MKALLMHPDRDFDLLQELPRNEPDLTQDLELDMLLHAMAGEDEFLSKVARQALFSGMHNEIETILYRQAILKDCLEHPAVVRELYTLAVTTIEQRKRGYWGVLTSSPSSILYGSVEMMQMLTATLRKLKGIADAQANQFESKGFTALFEMLQTELNEDYFASIRSHLTQLKFRSGVLVSAELGVGNEGSNYILRRHYGKGQNWLMRLLGTWPSGYSFRIADRDEAGSQILSEIQNRGINLVANAVAQSADHILSFFDMLKTELAFYVACLNLCDRLSPKGLPLIFPAPEPIGSRKHSVRNLQDVSLALTMDRAVVGNNLGADGKSFVVITGANQGGKSSFLRSVGVAQLMMQSGMFVAAEYYAAELCAGVFTHYKREEDATMNSGKLDEELGRMSNIVETIVPNSLLLCNESFASTNEREGSEIARQIVCALLERRVKIVFVTHLYEFAHGMVERNADDSVFLLAERKADGTRTFRLIEGQPSRTSYGTDLYQKIFVVESDDDGQSTEGTGSWLKG
jgi:hypothetical protein